MAAIQCVRGGGARGGGGHCRLQSHTAGGGAYASASPVVYVQPEMEERGDGSQCVAGGAAQQCLLGKPKAHRNVDRNRHCHRLMRLHVINSQLARLPSGMSGRCAQPTRSVRQVVLVPCCD